MSSRPRKRSAPAVPGVGLQEILRTSCHLLAERGYHGTSIRDLAHSTGRSLSGLYHYFGRKEDLLYLINYHGFTTLNETWHRIADLSDDPVERLYAFVYSHIRHFVDHLDEMRVLTWGTQELGVDQAREIQVIKDRYTRVARGLIADATEAVTGQTLEGRRLTRETFILFGMMNWIFGWYSSRAHGRVDDLVDDIFCTFLHGVCGAPATNLDDFRAKVAEWFDDNGTSSMWETSAGHPRRAS